MEQPSPEGLPSPQDWATIWQSELAALAVDRECNEGFFAWGQAWVTAFDDPAGRSGPDAPPGATPAGATPGAELAEELGRALAGLATRSPP